MSCRRYVTSVDVTYWDMLFMQFRMKWVSNNYKQLKSSIQVMFVCFFCPVCVGRLNTLQLRHTNPGGVCRWNISTISTHCCSANLSGLHACFQVATHGGGGFIRSRRGTSLASAWQQMPFVISVPGRRAATQQTSKNCQGDKYIDTGGSGMWGRAGERPHFLFAFIQRSG